MLSTLPATCAYGADAFAHGGRWLEPALSRKRVTATKLDHPVDLPIRMLQIESGQALEAGAVVGCKYRLERVLGEGGMGSVWAAEHLVTRKRCALKFLKASRSSDPRAQERLLDEARAICEARHPNIAEVHDVLELDNGAPFLVMDLLQGETLGARIARVPALDVPAIRRILSALVAALGCLHRAQLVHRDLKPENVFLEDIGEGEAPAVRVLDFGIAKHFDAPLDGADALASSAVKSVERRHLTRTTAVVGTPAYMAPELRAGTPVGPATDVFALGAIVYECFTRELVPRVGDANDADLAHARQALTGSDCPEPLAGLVLEMLASTPDRRPALDAIARALEGLGLGSRRPARGTDHAEAALAVTASAGRRVPLRLVLALTGSLLVGVGALGLAVRTSEARSLAPSGEAPPAAPVALALAPSAEAPAALPLPPPAVPAPPTAPPAKPTTAPARRPPPPVAARIAGPERSTPEREREREREREEHLTTIPSLERE